MHGLSPANFIKMAITLVCPLGVGAVWFLLTYSPSDNPCHDAESVLRMNGFQLGNCLFNESNPFGATIGETTASQGWQIYLILSVMVAVVVLLACVVILWPGEHSSEHSPLES